MVRLPDAVGFQALSGRERVIVRVTRDAVEPRLQLDRPGSRRDFDAIWPAIAEAAELRIVQAQFEARRDPATGLRVVTLDRFDLGVPSRRPIPGPQATPAAAASCAAARGTGCNGSPHGSDEARGRRAGLATLQTVVTRPSSGDRQLANTCQHLLLNDRR